MAPLDLLENPEMMVKLANLANQASADPPDLRELVDSQELLACPASKDTEGIQVLMVQRERPELLGPRVSLVLPERLVLLDQWALVVCLVREAVLDPAVPRVLVETTVCPVLPVLLAPSAPQELQASLALPVQREKLAPLALVDPRELRDPVESPVPLDHLDPLELLGTPVRMVSLELKDQLVLLVLLVLLVSLDLVDLLGLKELLDLSGPKEHLETPVSQGSREKPDLKENLDLLASRDLMARRERREREDPGVSPVLLDHLDLMEREDPLETVASPARTVYPVLRVPPVSVDLAVPAAPRGPMVTQGVLESPVFLVPEA